MARVWALPGWSGPIFLFLLVSLAWAQEPPPQESPPTFEFPEVVVPGKRPQSTSSTPASVSIITREDLDHLGVRTVADALRLLPELTVRSSGGLGSLALPSIRGSTPAQVLVLLDGIPLNSVALGLTDLSTISTDGIERIEVLRGPFAALYGSGALGGVINIVTQDPGHGQQLVRVGSLEERTVHLALHGAGAVAWQIGLTAEGTGGDRPNSDYTGTTAIVKVVASPTVRLLVHHYRADLGTPGDINAPTPNDRQSERRTVVQLDWGRRDKIGLSGRVYYLGDQLTFLDPFGSSVFSSSVAGAEVQQVWKLDAGRWLTSGIELAQQTLDATVFGSPINGVHTIGAGYLQYDAALSPRLLASLGVRLDVHSVYGTTANPRAGVVYQLSSTTRMRAAVGRTFRGPTFLELFFPGCSNPNLRPESAWSGEVGLEHQIGPAIVAVTAFGTEATDLIIGGCNPQNIGAASIRGISAEVRRVLSQSWMVSANITGLQAVDRMTGAAIARVPGVTANLDLSYQITPASTLTLTAAYVGPRPDFDTSVFPAALVELPPYLEVRSRYQVQTSAGWTLTVGINNLLDQHYEVTKGFPAPGRTLFVAAATRF